jgi:hypothetical protein
MIHLNYDHKQNNGIIFNTTYPNGAMYVGIQYKPTLSFEYDSFQYSEVFADVLDYVQLGNSKTVMTPEQGLEIKAIADVWVQPLGQEGNPNDEQKLQFIKQAVQEYLNERAVALGFDSIDTIAKYMGFTNSYQADAESLAQLAVSVWEYVEAEAVKMATGQRTIPTNEKAISELTALGL